MSGLEVWSAVSGIAIPAVIKLCDIPRNILADKLKNGELTAEKWREMIIPKLDNINSKLKDLAGVELLASVSFLREGVVRLSNSLETTAESRDEPSTSAGSSENQAGLEGATAMISATDIIPRTSQLSQRVRTLNIASQDRYKSSKESFKESKNSATKAFCNVVLSIGERLLASILRIVSRILECLDDPEAGVQDCLLYLTELHDLPAIQAMVSVWRHPDEGILSRFQAFFRQKERNDNVMAITMINELLINFAIDTNIKINFWPRIKTEKEFYHPLFDDPVLCREIKEKGFQIPLILDHFYPFDPSIDEMALTSKGEILYTPCFQYNALLVTANGKKKVLLYTIPKEKEKDWKIRCFTLDDNDNVYVVIEISSRGVPVQYKLLILDTSGNVTEERNLGIIKDQLGHLAQMSISKDGKVVVYCLITKKGCIFDRNNTKPGKQFSLSLENMKVFVKERRACYMSVSNDNEIIFISPTLRGEISVCIVAMDGNLKHTVQLPVPIECNQRIECYVYNTTKENILVSAIQDSREETARTTIYTFSMRGELLHEFDTHDEPERLLSHPNGLLVLVGKRQNRNYISRINTLDQELA